MHVKGVIAAISMIIAVGALPSQAVAAPQKPVIAAAAIDAGTGTVLLRGFNFPTNPKVYMGKEGEGMNLLQVRNSSPNTIEATLKTISSGTYSVTVLEGGADLDPNAPFVPQALPMNSPVFADAMIFVIRQK